MIPLVLFILGGLAVIGYGAWLHRHRAAIDERAKGRYPNTYIPVLYRVMGCYAVGAAMVIYGLVQVFSR